MSGIPPVNLDHIHELSSSEKMLRQYSTLDLCRLEQFTIITNSSASLQKTSPLLTLESVSRYGLKTVPPLFLVCIGKDFEFVYPEKSQAWLDQFHLGQGQHGAVLVRPDQHILHIWDEFPSTKEVEEAILPTLIHL